MLAGAELVARLAVGRRLAGGLMEHEPVNALAKGIVGVGFQVGRPERPVGAVLFLLGERFSHRLPFAVDVGRRGSLLEVEPEPGIGVVPARGIIVTVYPEFAGRDIAPAQVFQGILRGYVVGSPGFVAHQHPVGMAKFGEPAVIILTDAILYGAVEIVPEPVGNQRILNRISGEYWQVGYQVVSSESPELVGEILRPGEFAAFPAVRP